MLKLHKGLWVLRIERTCGPLIFEVEVTPEGEDWRLTFIDGSSELYSKMRSCLEGHEFRPEVYAPRSGPGDEMSTCFKCPDNTTCKLAWDDYNLDGDCLMSK